MEELNEFLFCLPRSSFGNVTGDANGCSPYLACKAELFIWRKSFSDPIYLLSKIDRVGPGIELFVRFVHAPVPAANVLPFTFYFSPDSKNRSASMAAIHPEPAAVTA